MDIANTSFDYTTLGSDARGIVEQKTVEIRDRIGRAAQNIVEIGERLNVVKGKLPHGDFGEWLKLEFGWGHSTAAKMMQVATKFPDYGNLNIGQSALYLLAGDATPEPIRERFVEQAKAGKKVTHKEVKQAVDEAKHSEPPKPAAAPPPSSPEKLVANPPAPAPIPVVVAAVPAEPTQPAWNGPAATWEEMAARVDHITDALAAMERTLRKAFSIKGQEMTDPFAARYTFLGTVGAVASLRKYLEHEKPVGFGPHGVITSHDATKRAKVLAATGRMSA